MHSHPGALQIVMMFALAVLLFRPRRRIGLVWLSIAVFLVVVGLFTT
jgi:hypothetical protein